MSYVYVRYKKRPLKRILNCASTVFALYLYFYTIKFFNNLTHAKSFPTLFNLGFRLITTIETAIMTQTMTNPMIKLFE